MKDEYYTGGYHFRAEGNVYDLTKEVPHYILFKRMIEGSKHNIGDMAYLIFYNEGYNGCYYLGEIAIYDVDDLLSKVLKEDSITATVGTDTSGYGIIKRFTDLLDKEGIRYDEEWTRMD